MDSGLLLSLAASTLALAAPLALAALGGFFSERSGVINIALEGMMLLASCSCVLGSVLGGQAWIGLVAGLATAVLAGALHWLATQRYRIDAVISGMAINLIALGATNFFSQKLLDPDRPAGFASFPVEIYEGIAIVLPLVALFWTSRTRSGLRLRASGSDPDKARLAGLDPVRTRLGALILSGLLCGLSGCLIATNAGGFTDNMTAGRGYVALAALILAGWRPLRSLLMCAGFGFLFALQISLQGREFGSIRIPTEIWASLPYLLTIVALAGFMGRNRAPSGLGKV